MAMSFHRTSENTAHRDSGKKNSIAAWPEWSKTILWHPWETVLAQIRIGR